MVGEDEVNKEEEDGKAVPRRGEILREFHICSDAVAMRGRMTCTRARSWHRESGSPPSSATRNHLIILACHCGALTVGFVVVDDKRNDGRVSAIPSELLRFAKDETALGLKHSALNAKTRHISVSSCSSVWGGTTKSVSKIQIKDSMGAHM